MKLLQYKDYQVTISDDAYLVKSIRSLFNKDKTKHKEKFFEQMTFLYFFADLRSDYNYIIDEDERRDTIIEKEGLSKGFKYDDELKAAVEDYIRLTATTSSNLLRDTKVAIDKVRKFLRDVDLNLLDDKGKPVYTINSITTAIKLVPQLAKDIMETEKIVNKEIEASNRARGGNDTLKILEDLNI